jgi:hypothetical protein
MNKETIKAIARHGLTTAGGALIAQGVGDESIVNEAVGIIVGVIGLVWSIIEKRARAKAAGE